MTHPACLEITPSDVWSNSTFIHALAFHLSSIPKRDIAQARTIRSEDSLAPKPLPLFH